MAPGASVAVTSAGSDFRLYAIVEASREGGASGRDGGMIRALAADSRWLAESGGTPSCGAMDTTMAVFSMLAARDVPIVLPPVSEPDARVLLVAVPVLIGAFAVSLTSSSGCIYDRLAVVSEAVMAWRDRDHRLLNVPQHLLGGVLFQGPYKDVPLGTVLTVRPNARSKVHVIVERSNSGGLAQTLPAAGWAQDASAPRWHDTPTMVSFRRMCAAGGALSLPSTQGAGAVLSVVVVPIATVPVAPLEVSCCFTGAADSVVPMPEQPDIVGLSDGAVWDLEGHCLTKVPPWMQGAAYLPTRHMFGSAGAPAGTLFSIRAAPASVVYAIVEATREGTAGRCGGLLPQALPAAGWEQRAEAPEAGPRTTLAVYAKRVGAREVLSLPPLSEGGGLLGLVVKVDLEAFDATVETSTGLELQRASLQETVLAWIDRPFRYAWVPASMTGGVLFRGPHLYTADGTALRVSASGSCRVYIVVEKGYIGGSARDGGFVQSLPARGWRTETAAPSWNDKNSDMACFSVRLDEGSELVLPATKGDAVFSIVVVNIAGNPDRIADEVKQTFQAWDATGLGCMRREDMDALLATLCPGLDAKGRSKLLAEADPKNTGRINHLDFMSKVLFSSAPTT